MTAITKEMTILEILSSNPQARAILKDGGIKFIGRSASPHESLEHVAKANGLADTQIEGLVSNLNRSASGKSGSMSISLSGDAAEELKNLLSKRAGKKGLRLRLVSAGCAVYTYDLDFASKALEDEFPCRAGGLVFFVEKRHRDLLNGLRIAYDRDAKGFVFENPNVREQAQNAC